MTHLTAKALGLWVLIFSLHSPGAEFTVPPLKAPVNDYAGIVSARDTQQLNSILHVLRKNHNTQMAILTVSSLNGLTIEQASIAVADHWKLGDQNKDDGLLLMVAPNERKVRIEVGQGLEGDLPDVIAHRIIENIILPEFKAGKMSSGILLGTVATIQQIYPELDLSQLVSEKVLQQAKGKSTDGLSRYIINILIFLFFFIFVLGGNRRGGLSGFLLGTALGHGMGGRSGGGGFGGGGGGFSGGGASGGW